MNVSGFSIVTKSLLPRDSNLVLRHATVSSKNRALTNPHFRDPYFYTLVVKNLGSKEYTGITSSVLQPRVA